MINKHNYLNKNIDHLKSVNIREYDIKSAGFNILISSNAIDNKTIDFLNTLPKQKRNKEIGLMCLRKPELSDIINEGLMKYRKKFIEDNEIEDENILSIKRDAIFIIQKVAKIRHFDGVQFVEKNKYTSYYLIDDNEFYYSNDTLDIKGLGKIVPKIHKDYIIKFLKHLFKRNEESSEKVVLEYLYEFADDYRKLKVNPEFYRELNKESLFRYNASFIRNRNLIGSKYAPDDIKILDISYNYNNVILELIRILY